MENHEGRTITHRDEDVSLSLPAPATAKILIVDDHKLFADAIRSALSGPDLEVVGMAGTASEAVAVARRTRPDLVLVDIGLPDADGLIVGKNILEEFPDTKVVALTALSDAQTVKQALALGFNGYLTKETPIGQFLSAVRAVLGGTVVIPHRLAPAAAGARSQDEVEAARRAERLTARERTVLTLLAQGANTDEIAARLTVSPNTVRTHVQNILTKLEVRSRLEAAASAVRYGLVEVGRRNGR